MASDYEKIYARYKQIATELSSDAKTILKTDAHNEAYIEALVPEGAHVIEINSNVVKDAKRAHPELNIIQGDIRELPYEDKMFDLVMDFSTIDHIDRKGVEDALKEYKRTLKDDGKFFVVCWVASGDQRETRNDVVTQYVFARKWFEDSIKKHFEITDTETLLNQHNRTLEGYYCDKT